MQNAKTIFLKTLNLEKADRVPCAPHWWGRYKYELPGHDYMRDAWQDGRALSGIYIDFYKRFRPDWFHLHIGTPIYFRDSEIIERDGASYLVIDPRYRPIKKEDRYFSVLSSDDEKIVDFPDYLLGSRARRPKVDLTNRRKIDEYIKRYVRMNTDEIIGMGYTDHLPEIVKRFGEDVLIAVHIPSAICEIFDPTTGYLGFESGLMALHDYPDGMRYLVQRCYEEQLQWAYAYARAGVHMFIISESYISPDIAGAGVYREYLKPVHREYFKEVSSCGMVPVLMFWGDVNPILDDLKEINIRALMIEESKKGFFLDAAGIAHSMSGRVCVFGNQF